jgi:hypothetical protein
VRAQDVPPGAAIGLLHVGVALADAMRVPIAMSVWLETLLAEPRIDRDATEAHTVDRGA